MKIQEQRTKLHQIKIITRNKAKAKLSLEMEQKKEMFFIVGTNKINNGHRFVSNKIYLNVWDK